MKKLVNKVALITGASSGIGKATAERFVKEGAKVVIADHNLERAIELFGGIDCIVNNIGGINLSKELSAGELDINYFDEVMHVNLHSMIATAQAALPYMISRKEGCIVNEASISGFLEDSRGTLYGISKAGVINLTRYIATQYGKYEIRCNAVAPGLILTPAAVENLTQEERVNFLRHNSLPYAGKPEDIANVITFLASEDARYITGQTIVADGGMSCHNPTL